MSTESSIISRYEAKYLVSEKVAWAIREAIQGTCSPDEHVDSHGRYIVNNLYFETPDLRFYHDTKFKRYRRFKPRVRFYGMEPDRYLWVELKHKVKTVTWKNRRRVEVSDWPGLLDAPCENGSAVRSLDVSESFEDAVRLFQAQPMLHVRYVREPYVSNLESYGRVTFDRQLTFRLAHGSLALEGPGDMLYYDDPITAQWPGDDSPVILEIKTELNIPSWVVRLIQSFGLLQRGFSKYCYALDHSFAAAGGGGRASALV